MDEPTRDTQEWRARAAELANELRSIAEELAARELDSEALREATELARRIRDRLDGPVRPRWYDADADAMAMGPGAERAYLDQSPIRGRLNPIAPPMVLSIDRRAEGRPRMLGRVRLGTAYEGPPHGVHGGWVAALFDDLLGATLGLARLPAVTALLKIRYVDVTPIGEDLQLEGWIDRVEGRRMVARARCHAGTRLTAEAEGVFMAVDFNEMQERMRSRQARST